MNLKPEMRVDLAVLSYWRYLVQRGKKLFWFIYAVYFAAFTGWFALMFIDSFVNYGEGKTAGSWFLGFICACLCARYVAKALGLAGHE